MAFIDPLASFSRGQSLVTDFSNQLGQRQAAQGLASGNYAQALSALGGMGDLGGVIQVQNAREADETRRRARISEDRTRNVATYRQALDAIKARAATGNAVQAFDEVAPFLKLTGADEAALMPLRQALERDPTGTINTLEAALGKEEMEIRDGGGGDVVGINKRTGESRLLYDAPDRPIATQYGILLPPTATVGRGTVPGVAPVTGAQIQSNGLWQRQEQQESGGRQWAADGSLLTSPKGAFGVAQLMPGTAADLAREMGVSVEELQRNPELNRQAGQRYQQQQLDKYDGNQALALAAYNAGPGRVDQWLQTIGDPRTGEITTEEFVSRIPYAETRQYVQNITQGRYGEQPVEQGSESGASTQDLGGGWSLQAMQTPADRRADRAEQRAERAEARQDRREARESQPVETLSQAESERLGLPSGSVVQRRADGSINVVSKGGSERYTDGQRQSASFAFRLQNAATTLNNLERSGVARPSAAILAFGEGRIRENALGSEDRRFLQAAREWLAPVLRKDTGAAVGPGELITYMGIYLPSPTDDAATLEQKRQARRVAEQALRAQAGGAYAEMFPQAAQGNRPRTNAPGVPFDLSPAQLRSRNQFIQSGQADHRAQRGSRSNPIYVNPDPSRIAQSRYNIPGGAWFYDENGRLFQMPRPNPFRRGR